MIRTGLGYDVHRFDANRKLILGGVEVESPFGLLGHSDADVLIHAIMDALLGAIGEGDIGRHFPDSSDDFKGISSVLLLQRVALILQEKGAVIHNVDSTIVAEKPRLAPYIDSMREKLSEVLNIPHSAVNVKATTTEGLGFTGKGEGIAAYAIATIDQTGN